MPDTGIRQVDSGNEWMDQRLDLEAIELLPTMSDFVPARQAAVVLAKAMPSTQEDKPLFARYPHTKQFPVGLWQELNSFASQALHGCTFPEFGRSSDAAVTRQRLLKILESAQSTLSRYTKGYDNEPARFNAHECQKHIDSIKLAISYIESWQLADGENRRAMLKNDPSSTHHQYNEDIEPLQFNNLPPSNLLAASVEMGNSSEAAKSTRTLELLIYIVIENQPVDDRIALKQRTKTALTLQGVSYDAPVSNVLRLLGATNPKTDFLSFRRQLPNAGRDRNGVPLTIPSRYELVGWPGTSWANGEKIKFKDLMKYAGATKAVDQSWDLECTFKRAWVEVKDRSKDVNISGQSDCGSRNISDVNFLGRNPTLPEKGMIPLGPIGQSVELMVSQMKTLYGRDIPSRDPLVHKFMGDCTNLLAVQATDPQNYELMRQLILFLNQKVAELEDEREIARVQAAEQLSCISLGDEYHHAGDHKPLTDSTFTWKSEYDKDESPQPLPATSMPADILAAPNILVGGHDLIPLIPHRPPVRIGLPTHNETVMVETVQHHSYSGKSDEIAYDPPPERPMIPDNCGGGTPPRLHRWRNPGKNASALFEDVPAVVESAEPRPEDQLDVVADDLTEAASIAKSVLRTPEEVKQRYLQNMERFEAINRDPANARVSRWSEEVEAVRHDILASRFAGADVHSEGDKRTSSSSPGKIKVTSTDLDEDKLCNSSWPTLLIGPPPRPKKKDVVRPLAPTFAIVAERPEEPALALPDRIGDSSETPPRPTTDGIIEGDTNGTVEVIASKGAAPTGQGHRKQKTRRMSTESGENLAIVDRIELDRLVRKSVAKGLDKIGMTQNMGKSVEDALERANINALVAKSVEEAMRTTAENLALVVAEAVGPISFDVEQLKREVAILRGERIATAQSSGEYESPDANYNVQNTTGNQDEYPLIDLGTDDEDIGTIYGLSEAEGFAEDRSYAVLPSPVRKGRTGIPERFAERLQSLWFHACLNTPSPSECLSVRDREGHEEPPTRTSGNALGGAELCNELQNMPRFTEDEGSDDEWEYDLSNVSIHQHEAKQVRIQQLDAKQLRLIRSTNETSDTSSISPSDSISNVLARRLPPTIQAIDSMSIAGPSRVREKQMEQDKLVASEKSSTDESVPLPAPSIPNRIASPPRPVKETGPILEEPLIQFHLTGLRETKAIGTFDKNSNCDSLSPSDSASNELIAIRLLAGEAPGIPRPARPTRILGDYIPPEVAVAHASKTFTLSKPKARSKSDSAPDPWLPLHEEADGTPSLFRGGHKAPSCAFRESPHPFEAAIATWVLTPDISSLGLSSSITSSICAPRFLALKPCIIHNDTTPTRSTYTRPAMGFADNVDVRPKRTGSPCRPISQMSSVCSMAFSNLDGYSGIDPEDEIRFFQQRDTPSAERGAEDMLASFST
ncbi:hypothetical protein TWF696_006617 [Orbilia brochopaga]|uniref:Uncharacterized protein n=1 Tax=Orbilia brochopaga TaxID=3140254 RepID=A0AAV9UQA5_9PEZI